MAWIETFSGKCRNCMGRGIIVKIVFKFLPILQRCPRCEGKGAIEVAVDPVPRSRLLGIEKSILR